MASELTWHVSHPDFTDSSGQVRSAKGNTPKEGLLNLRAQVAWEKRLATEKHDAVNTAIEAFWAPPEEAA